MKSIVYMFQPMKGRHWKAANTSKKMLHIYYVQVLSYKA
jgi:hypothetical protein